MRGEEKRQSELVHVFSVEEAVSAEHPLREIRKFCDCALARLGDVFEGMYSDVGRPSIAPETVLKSLILQALYSIRSERQLCEQIGYNILFRWFLGLSLSERVFDATVFTKNRERLIEHEVGKEFLRSVVEEAKARGYVSDEHFTVDGTLIEAWASFKSFKPKEGRGHEGPPGRNPDSNFHGETRSNQTHQSTTDPDARLAKKGAGKEAKLSYCGNILMENREGLIVDAELKQATGTAEVEAAITMLDRRIEEGEKPKTVGADKNYHQRDFVTACRKRNISPHIAQHSNRSVSGLDKRTTRH